MKRGLTVLSMPIFLLFPFTLCGEIIQASHLHISEGLQQTTIYSIYQDEFGMIWFGTKNGLVLFDGNKTEYIHKINQDIPQSESLIRQICGNKRGEIYLSTRSEVIAYDIQHDIFSIILNQPGIIHYGTDNLWICQNNKVFKWENDSLTSFITLTKEEISIDCLLETPQKELYLGTREHGIFHVQSNGKVKNYYPQVKQIKQLLFDSEQYLWIATRRGGIHKMDRNGQLISFNRIPGDASSLSDNIVRDICVDDQENLWIATYSGLNKYIRKDNQFIKCNFLNDNFNTLNDNSIYSLFKDAQGNIWTGSYMGEINYFDPNYETLTYHFSNSRNEFQQNQNIVFGRMIEDKRGNQWVCAERNGLFHYNKQNGKLTPYPLEDGVHVQTVYMEPDKQILWVGTLMQGLLRIDLQKNVIRSFKLRNNSIREIIPYHDKLLVATHDGIFIFNPLDGTHERIESNTCQLDDRPVISMMVDRHENLWIAFDNRIIKYDLVTHDCELVKLNEESSSFVNKIFENREGDIWIGTKREGLYILSEGSNKPVNYNKSNGLSSNLIIDIAQDKDGNAVLVTGSGLSYFIEDTQQMINIQREKLFPQFRLSENCLFINSENKVFIGGVNVICELSVQNLLTQSKDYRINFSGISVNGVQLEVTPRKGILPKSLLYCEKLILPANSKYLNITVFTDHYSAIFKSGIYYKLEGFDKDWKEVNGLNEITYTSLPPGKYTLYVKGGTPLSNGNYPEKELQIEVKAPFYQTGVAYFFYFLFALSLLYAVYRFVMLRSSLRFEKEQKKYIEEVNQSKLKFFTNVSHEFKTPLMLIYNHVESLLNAKIINPGIQRKLLGISKNATRLNQLIDELMEFKKQEQGFQKLHVSKYNMADLIQEVTSSFENYAQSRKITLRVEATPDDTTFYFDVHQIEKTIFNLLSNAFKFTPDGGNILIQLEKLTDAIQIKISDSGIGISQEDQKKIFDLFYQAQDFIFSCEPGTGIGLAITKNIIAAHQGSISVKSTKGKGSCFTVLLPTHISYKPEEIEENTLFITKEHFKENFIPQDHSLEMIHDQQVNQETHDTTLLLVEENEEMRALLFQSFSPLYHVVCAENGQEGYEKAIQVHPDIVLCDIAISEMSDIDLCKKLKNNIDTLHIPFILLTSRSASESVIEGLKAGADDYITKPFGIQELIVRCNNLINTRKILQERFDKGVDNELTEQIATTGMDQSIIDDSIRIIHENLDNPLFSIDFIARSLNMGRTKYFSKIKTITGMTPNEFVIKTKIKHAMKLLNNNSQISINELSESLGFKSVSHFIRLFKEFAGVTPNEYKAKKISW
ncbi:hybrid sensor histidine kinase/response regulator transcription factor [Proteiniphilum sp. UBA1028]|jgi:signal transduction histidine kinase/ligand-binding sensor domain-containing protein/DNA-binding NarL/FixJ family response regulator|uniref:hybrid sensor histidine kinase/response regulator transcription factor n=1 Tax=Proteiniphilum sp. UBA1028 TaxID=1947251 RepID=UPI0025CDABDF|nr:hybrid sensor histidine kinase/response regulator transcription factor [Proteiniphilum sp. UBA1028]